MLQKKHSAEQRELPRSPEETAPPAKRRSDPSSNTGRRAREYAVNNPDRKAAVYPLRSVDGIANPQKDNKTKLYQTQVMYEHLFESTLDANILVNETSTIIAVNRQAEKLFGYSREELVGRSIEELVPEDRRASHVALRATYMRNPIPRPMAAAGSPRLELTARKKDRSVFPTEITLNPVKVGDQILILCVVRDISVRIERERELHRQAELVHLLQDVAVAANEAVTVNSAFQFALNRVTQMLGWPIGHAYLAQGDEAILATPIWAGASDDRFGVFKAETEALRFQPGAELPNAIPPSEQPVWLANLPENPQFSRKRAAFQAGLRTGLEVPIMAGREVVGMLEFFTDQDLPSDPNLLAVLPHIGMQLGRVIERHRSEYALRNAAAQLRTVVVNLPVILWVIDREGRVLMIEGKGVAEAQTQPEKLLGKNILQMLDTRPELLESIKSALSGEEVHLETSISAGAVFETYLMPYFDVNWAVDGVIGLSFNISERKRMESELDEMKHRLIDSLDKERALLAQQLHDGPLQDLFGAYYQIQEIKGSLDPHGQEVAARAMDTIQGVNARLRVICGELHPNTLIHLGLEKAIRSHVERLQERIEGTIFHLELDHDEQKLPNNLRLGLYRIYQQLISNAAFHSAARDIWIRLKLESGQVILEVEDNGQGFEVPRHWINLVRKGSLGLVNSMERIEGLHGDLKINTSSGKGTRVRVTAPLIN